MHFVGRIYAAEIETCRKTLFYIYNLLKTENAYGIINLVESTSKLRRRGAGDIVGKAGFIANEIELDRDVQKELLDWKNKRHTTVLQVEGPRQVGKTHEITKFACSNYEQVIYVNLVRDEFGFEDMMNEPGFLNAYCRKAGIGDYRDDASAILIIDEIQEKASVYNAVRDLREGLGCDIVISGSYLARTVNSRDFFLPAGIAYLKMYPLSFREFCRAKGLEKTYDGLDLSGGSESADYDGLEKAYQIYRHIGGYPQVVTTYLKTGDEAACLDVLEDLLRTFTAESSRFFANPTALSIFNETYRAVMSQILDEKQGTGRTLIEGMTDFVRDSMKEPVSRSEVRAAASWLLYSGIIGYCDLCNNGDVKDIVSSRRAYFRDNGIAWLLSRLSVSAPDAAEGMLTETFAFNEISRFYQRPASCRRVRGERPCFGICGGYELDFMIVDENYQRYGLEVKTKNDKARSLEYFKRKNLVDRAVKAALSRGGHGAEIDTIPIYMVGRML